MQFQFPYGPRTYAVVIGPFHQDLIVLPQPDLTILRVEEWHGSPPQPARLAVAQHLFVDTDHKEVAKKMKAAPAVRVTHLLPGDTVTQEEIERISKLSHEEKKDEIFEHTEKAASRGLSQIDLDQLRERLKYYYRRPELFLGKEVPNLELCSKQLH